MAGYNDRFGGSTITAAEVAYRKLELTTTLETAWPAYSSVATVLARAMDINAQSAGLAVVLPDAREASPGQDVLFYNNGSLSFTVVAKDGTLVTTVSPGERQYLMLADNTAEGGAWLVTNFGVGTSALDIAAAAGPGLLALGTTLGLSRLVVDENVSRDVTSADRARVIRWGGGVGALALPLTSSFTRFELSVNNQGTGALTLTPAGGETIDGNVSVTLNIGESIELHAAVGGWVSVGRGRSVQFSFTQLQKTITGGLTVLSLTEAANVVQTYTGALAANAVIELPGVVQIYYVSNQTTGPYSLTLKNPGVGATVVVPQGENVIVFSDGTNLLNASTTTAVVSGSIVFNLGSAAFATAGFGSTDTGIFSPGPGQVGITGAGEQIAQFDADGLTVMGDNANISVESSSTAADVGVAAPVGVTKSLSFYSGSSIRWRVSSEGTPEPGSNAGAALTIGRYSDTGVLLGNALTIVRSSGEVQVPVLTLGMDPVAFNQAATKNYVDGLTPTPITTGHVLGVNNLGQLLTTSSGSQVDVTLPSDATAAIRIGAVILLVQRGAGVVRLLADTGVTLVPATVGAIYSPAVNKPFGVLKLASNTWMLVGTRI